jgi:hypothetical protein
MNMPHMFVRFLVFLVIVFVLVHFHFVDRYGNDVRNAYIKFFRVIHMPSEFVHH